MARLKVKGAKTTESSFNYYNHVLSLPPLSPNVYLFCYPFSDSLEWGAD
jgi:hypothetical protein